jgi:regulator of sigma E protease
MISLLASLVVFGILIFIHELGHFLLAKKNGVRVETFSFGFGPKLWGKKVGDTEYRISAVLLGGYVKMAGDEPAEKRKGAPWEYSSKSCGQRAQIIIAGPLLNYLLAFFIFALIFIIGSPVPTSRVGALVEDYPAKAAGVKEGDVILAVNGEKVQYWQDMAEVIHKKTEGEIALDIKRGDEIYKISLTPEVQETQDIFGEKRKVALIGISPSDEVSEVKYGWGESFYRGGEKLFALTGLSYKSLWLILTRRLSLKESVAGPIMMFQLTGSAAKLGFIYLLNLMGVISAALAIFNVLPLPVLDGGHLLFIALEKLRRKPISVKIQEIATQAGMILLFVLVLFVSYNDLMRIGVVEKVTDWWGSRF